MNRKQELITKRNADIFNDYCKMFIKEGMRPDAIYTRLVERYYLDTITISRIVTKQAKLERAKLQVNGIP